MISEYSKFFGTVLIKENSSVVECFLRLSLLYTSDLLYLREAISPRLDFKGKAVSCIQNALYNLIH